MLYCDHSSNFFTTATVATHSFSGLRFSFFIIYFKVLFNILSITSCVLLLFHGYVSCRLKLCLATLSIMSSFTRIRNKLDSKLHDSSVIELRSLSHRSRYKGTRELSSSEKYKITKEGDVYVLVINSVYGEDADEYCIKASTKAGSRSSRADLVIKSEITFQKFRANRFMYPTSFKLSCFA